MRPAFSYSLAEGTLCPARADREAPAVSVSAEHRHARQLPSLDKFEGGAPAG
jgi:hypothetical protein